MPLISRDKLNFGTLYAMQGKFLDVMLLDSMNVNEEWVAKWNFGYQLGLCIWLEAQYNQYLDALREDRQPGIDDCEALREHFIYEEEVIDPISEWCGIMSDGDSSWPPLVEDEAL